MNSKKKIAYGKALRFARMAVQTLEGFDNDDEVMHRAAIADGKDFVNDIEYILKRDA